MSYPSDLPPFAFATSAELGIGRGRLAGPSFERPFHGVYRGADTAAAIESRHPLSSDVDRRRANVAAIAEAYAPRLREGQFFCGPTALALLGAPVPRHWSPSPLQIAVHRPSYPPRTAGVRPWRLLARLPATVSVGGLPVEHPVRAWVQASDEWDRDDLIAAGDYLLTDRSARVFGVTRQQLAHEARTMRGETVAHIATELRIGAESSEETALRLVITRAGVPEPRLQWQLRDEHGHDLARLDLAWPEYRVGTEYDGRQHATDPRQFARDADRWEAIRAEGWLLVRVLNHHVRPDPSVAVRRIQAALMERGWRPSR